MSYVISDRQYVGSVASKAKYVPYRRHLNSLIHEELEVGFGNPLYTIVSDFFEISKNLQDSSETESCIPIIPDGCVSIIIITRKNEIQGYLCGVIDKIHKIILHEGETAFIARYLPGGVQPFIKEPISVYTNQCCLLHKNFSNYSYLISTFAKTSTFSERMYAFYKAMRTQYLDKKETHYLLNYCVDKIYERKGNIKISDLSKETGFSQRYIGKLFDQWVGISPKLYAEIMQFQFSLKELEQIETKPDGNLLDIALNCGFFDHAHINRCYKRFLHCTIGKLRKSGFEGVDFSNVPKLIK